MTRITFLWGCCSLTTRAGILWAIPFVAPVGTTLEIPVTCRTMARVTFLSATGPGIPGAISVRTPVSSRLQPPVVLAVARQAFLLATDVSILAAISVRTPGSSRLQLPVVFAVARIAFLLAAHARILGAHAVGALYGTTLWSPVA